MRFRTLLGLAVLAALAGSPGRLPAQDAADSMKPRTEMNLMELIPLDMVFSVAGMDTVQVRSNIEYKTLEDRPLLADIYVPAEAKEVDRFPAVVFVAGGLGPSFQPRPRNWGLYRSYGSLMAASGMVGVTFDHRLGFPKRFYEEGERDLKDLVSHLREHATDYRIDPERIAIVVFSGGGPMLSWPLRDRPPYIRAVAGMYPFLDTEHVNPDEAGTTEEVVKRFSPARYVEESANMPPIFIARAGRDQIPGVNASIENFLGRAVESRLPLTFLIHPDGMHAFDWVNEDDRSRYIVANLVHFLQENLKKK